MSERTPGNPGANPQEMGLQKVPEALDLQRRIRFPDRSDLAIPPSSVPMLEGVGFSPLFSQRLGALWETLQRDIPPQKRQYNLRITGGQVEVQTKTENPFDVQIAGTESGETVISVSSNPRVADCWLKIGDIQNFTRAAFPNRDFLFHAEPVVMLYKPEGKEPDRSENDLLLEGEGKKNPDTSEVKSGIVNSSILPTIEQDLYEITHVGMKRLARQATAVVVDATFYEKWSSNHRQRRVLAKGQIVLQTNTGLYPEFKVLTKDEEDKTIMVFRVGQGNNRGDCYFGSLYFKGKAREVEEILEPLTEMFRQGRGYRLHDLRVQDEIDEKQEEEKQ